MRPFAVLLTALLLLGAGGALAQGDGEAGPAIDWVALAMGFSAGLVLFLLGVVLLSNGLRTFGQDRIRDLMERAARHRLRGLGAGIVATTVLDSSSVTIILVIALVDAGLLGFVHALPVILGSNIGTTVSSQVFALGIDEYAPVGMLAGFLLRSAAPSEGWRQAGTVLLGLGLVLFGLHTIGEAVEPLEENRAVLAWMERMETPLWGVLAGAVFTIMVQSSSATLGVVITLAGGGLLSLPAGLAMMLGAEIGTCADTLVATIGRSAAAVRAGVFHLLFNIISVAVGVLLIDWLAAFATWSSGETAQQIANAHVAFNVLGALIFIGITPRAATLLARLIPGRGETGAAAREAAPAG